MMQGCPCSHSSIPCSSHGLPSSPSYHGCIRCKYFSEKIFSSLISKIKFCGKVFRCKIFLGKIFLTATKPILSWVYQVAVFLSKIFLQPNFVAKKYLGEIFLTSLQAYFIMDESGEGRSQWLFSLGGVEKSYYKNV